MGLSKYIRLKLIIKLKKRKPRVSIGKTTRLPPFWRNDVVSLPQRKTYVKRKKRGEYSWARKKPCLEPF